MRAISEATLSSAGGGSCRVISAAASGPSDMQIRAIF